MTKLRNPIIETMLEIGLTYNFPAEAVVGILFSLLNDKYPNVQLKKSPIANIPEEIRNFDPNLKNKPIHQIVCKDGFIGLGDKILCIGISIPYSSWDKYTEFINNIWSLLKSKNIIKGVSYARLKYLNFFEENIYNRINLTIQFGTEQINYISTILKTEIPCKNNIVGGLQITNGVHVKNIALQLDADGSLIDIQTFTNNISIENLHDIVFLLHEQAENLFNKLIK